MDSLNSKIEKYLIVCRDAKGLSDLTIKAYTIDLRQFREYMCSRDYLSKEEISQYIELLHKRYKPKSVKRKTACIKSFYRYMEIENIITENPFHKIVIKYKMPTVLPKIIPLNYVEDILNYAYSMYNIKCGYQNEIALRNIVVLELLFSTGMRVSEISHLKVSNLDLRSKTIRIVGKGAKERIICIANDNVIKVLGEYLTKYNNNGFKYVLKNRLSNLLSEQSIRNMIDTYAKAAGVPLHITPHMFRHTFATALLEEDVDIRYIQQLLGHSSIVTTQIYTYISTAKIRSILEKKHPRNKFVFD